MIVLVPPAPRPAGGVPTIKLSFLTHPVGSEVEGVINSINEYAIYLKINKLDIDAFLHYNDLTHSDNGEEELKKYKKGQIIIIMKVAIVGSRKYDNKIKIKEYVFY